MSLRIFSETIVLTASCSCLCVDNELVSADFEFSSIIKSYSAFVLAWQMEHSRHLEEQWKSIPKPHDSH